MTSEELVLSREKLRESPLLVVGLPDVGLVGAIAVMHLIRSLNMSEVGYIDSDQFPPVAVVLRGEPKRPVRIFYSESHNTLAIGSEVALPLHTLPILARKVIELARLVSCRYVVLLGGVPVPNRFDIEKPKVYGIGVLEEDREFLKRNGVELIEEGFVAGAYALILKYCHRELSLIHI